MGKINYINVPEKDFSSGIDSRSAENLISPTFVRDLLNADIVEKRARVRKGYQGYAGNIPVRVTEMEYDDTNDMICFTLDSAVSLDSDVSLDNIRSSPIVVHGRSSTFTSGDGPFTDTDASKYYPGFTVPLRKTLTAPSGTLSIEASEHGLGTTNLFVGIGESNSLSSRSYQKIDVDSVDIDETTFDIDIDYTVATDKKAFVYFADKDTLTGSSFVSMQSHDGSPTTQSFTITAGTHALSNFNIVVEVQEDTGSERSKVRPDSVIIDPNGDVIVTITNDTGSTVEYYVLLSAAPLTNVITGNVAGNSSGTVTISDPEKPWIFFSVYLEQTPGGDRELVLPDTLEFDDDANEFTFSFTNSSGSPKNFIVFYEYGDIRSNVLCVTDTTLTTSGMDSRPQITIWGLDHGEIYGASSRAFREGWATHIDSYRRSAEQRLICGLGGNLFSAQTYAEAGTTYLYNSLYPSLSTRTASDLILGPAFWDTGETPERTRGYITSDSSGTHWARVTAVEFDSGNGYTKYTLSLPSKSILDSSGSATTLSSVISTTSGLEDYLTVQEMSYSRHNGTFRIKQIQDDIDQIYVWVENDANISSDYDDLGTGGEAGIFTDQLEWLANSLYIPGDRLLSDALDSSYVYNVLSSSTTTTVTSGVQDRIEIAAGVTFTGRRTSSVLPMRTSSPNATATVDNLVRGDMLSYTGLDRLLRILYINPDTNRTVNITSDGTTATATLTSGDTQYLTVGRSVVLAQAGVYTGVVEVTDIPSDTTFEFASTETATVNGATLVGETIQIDESLEWEDSPSDSIALTVAKRWIPIEAPDDSFNLTPSTYVRHLDSNTYGNQPFLRSAMVVDGMYLTNSDDEVMKFDGSNLYRSGMIAWQPGLFITKRTSGARIVTNLRSISYSALSATEGKLTVTAQTQASIPIAAAVRLSGSEETYIVRAYSDDGTDYYILLDRAIDSSAASSGTISEIGTRRYYFRLNAVDANDNILASAVTGHQDHVVELTRDTAVTMKLVGFPTWDIYDYDRLELQVYSTKLNQLAPFYLNTTIAMDFDNTQGYIEYTDTFADEDLTQLDEVNTALKGAELGVSWQGPMRAKYITSSGNRLVLANLRDYPQLDIQIVTDATTGNSEYAGDTLLFRRDNSDSGTSTNMADRVKYEWINGTTDNAHSFSIGSDEFSFDADNLPAVVAGDWIYLTYSNTEDYREDTFVDGDVDTGTDTITISSHGFTDNQIVQFSNVGGALPTGISAATNYYIVSATANTFQVSLTPGGSAIDITAAAGGGTHTLTLQANDLSYSGWYQIASESSGTITVNLVGASAASTYPDKYVVATDPTDVPVLLGTDGNLQMVNGDTFDTFDVMRRMSMAINASMRMVDVSISGMEEFTPWLVSRGGNDAGKAGRLIVRQPRADSLTPEVVPTFSGYSLFINSIARSSGSQVSASTRIFPSRLIFSYENFPEIFDNPTSILDSESDSAIDVNSADGQEITGIIPFFGEAAFGASQQSGILVVFKTNSIYLVDINQKLQGLNAVQKIETEGLGCTAPYSIAVTKGGIMFANESGIYCLRRNQSIEYIGKFMERNWTERVDLDRLALCQGHHYGVGRLYKLSVPIADTINSSTNYIENSEAYVYNHTSEQQGRLGAWSRYDNHPATGWANLGKDAFFASTSGRVFSIRNTGEITDYRDDSQAVHFVLDTRANDFGDSGIRKSVDNILIHYRSPLATTTSVSVSYSLDLEQEYTAITSPILARTNEVTGTSDTVQKDIFPITHNLNRRKCIYLQIRIENEAIDEFVEIAGIDYRIGGISDRGILAAQTTIDRVDSQTGT